MKKFTRLFLKTIFWALVIPSVLAVFCFFYFKTANTPLWGVNFSPDQARYLRLDPIETLSAILNELNIKKIRLVAYWETIEKEKGKYDFTETEALLKIAEKNGAKVILVLGRKQPRWPECHEPYWHKTLSVQEQKQALNNFVIKTVDKFKEYKVIDRWQIENEPFFNYGKDCPILTKEELKQEIELVKSLDNRPIVLTDSGEKGEWFKAGDLADVFGTTMYRTVYNPRWGGYISYHLPPAFYRIRAGLLQIFYGKKPIIGVELQAEPWFNGYVHDIPIKKHLGLMSPKQLESNINFAWNTGLSEHYFWGAEWWYYMKKRGYDEFWSIIKALNQ